MFNEKKVKEIILSVLVADSYSLGAHWIYDEKKLQTLDINWEELNAPQAIWHKGKVAGEFTHYGDQTLWLYQFIKDKESFDLQEYIDFWKTKMEIYGGYIDSASKNTLENIEKGISPTGSNSTDLSIVGRIAPLLLVSKDKDEFLNNVEVFIKASHNSYEATTSGKFFAKLLLEVLGGKTIQEAISFLREDFDMKIQSYIVDGSSSNDKDSFVAIRDFGPACDINGGFEGVMHLLAKYDNLKEMLINNAKAGGDSSARGMVATMIFMAQEDKTLSQIPSSWLNIKAVI
ncbi:MAG: ADP-ribosylglycohydrolase family protein [Halarcobacter sp.]